MRAKNPQTDSRRTSRHQTHLISYQPLWVKKMLLLSSLFLKEALNTHSLLHPPQRPAALPQHPHNIRWFCSLGSCSRWIQTSRAECTPCLTATEASGENYAQVMEVCPVPPSTATGLPKPSSPGLSTPYLSSGTTTLPQDSAARQKGMVSEKILWTWRMTIQLPVTQHWGASTSSGQLPPWSFSESPREPGKGIVD